ncbi:MAG: CDP-alcohol phosphatidyltransferase family protein [Nanoarchaeota archaeon]
MRVMTVANGITLFRLLCAFPLAALIVRGELAWAAGLYMLTAALDIVDGFVARHYQQKSDFGGYFDSATDSVLIILIIVMLFFKGIIPLGILLLFLGIRFLAFLVFGYFYLAEHINHTPLYVKTGVLAIHANLIYILLVPAYSVSVVLGIACYNVGVFIVSAVKIGNKVVLAANRKV